MEDSNRYKAKAVDFLKRYKVQDLTIDVLVSIFSEQGYQLVKYNTFEYVESTEILLQELGLKEYSAVNKAFSYKNGSIKVVFVDDALLESDKLYALLHEEGHIFCGHMERTNCSASNVEDEREANEFVHYVTNPPVSYIINSFLGRNKKIAIVAICILALGIIIPIVSVQTQTALLRNSAEYTKTLDYYITESGEKYHKEDCRIIQDKENVRRITEEEYNSGKYEPCKVCNP